MSPATEPRRGKEKRERKYGGGLSSRKHHHLQLCYSRGSNVADNDYGYKYVKSLASSLGPSIFYWSAHYFRHLSCVICIFIATSVLKRFILYYRRTFSTTYLSESFENSCRNLNGFSRLISKRLKDFCIRRRHWFLKMSPWRDGFVADIFPIFFFKNLGICCRAIKAEPSSGSWSAKQRCFEHCRHSPLSPSHTNLLV